MVFVRTVIPVVITEILFTTIAGVLVVTRVVSRYQRGISSTDDWLALGALVCKIESLFVEDANASKGFIHSFLRSYIRT